MSNLTSTTPFVSGRWRARLAISALVVGAIISLVAMFADIAQIQSMPEAMSMPDITEEELTRGDIITGVVGILRFLAFVSTAVLFSMWLYRASQNLNALGTPKQQLEYSPKWAVGSFFVPILNLFVPFRAVKEIWTKSDPNVDTLSTLSLQSPAIPSFIGGWWALWIISNIAGRIVDRISQRADTPEQLITVSKLEIIYLLINIVAAVFAILVVKRIDDRQEARSKMVTFLENPPLPTPLPLPVDNVNRQVTDH